MTVNRIAAMVAAAASLTAACGGGGQESTITTLAPTTTADVPSTEPAPESTTSIATTEAPAELVPVDTVAPDGPRQPLTGEPLASVDDIIDRPALAVKIDNHLLARANHTGLAVADIVFEELVEGSLTRFAAVFHSRDADPIGPIRSGREQDVNILTSLDEPLFAWSGGNPGVTALVRASFLTDLNWQRYPSSYYRGPGVAPHDLYSDSETLYALTPDDHPGAPRQQFEYLGEDESFDGEPATDVELRIGDIDIEWTWNAELGRYERSQEGDEHVDKTYGRVGAENVIVVVVDYKPSSIDANAPEAQMLGEGPVFVFSNGKVTTGTWRRGLAVYLMELTDERGDPIELTPGQTWVELAEATGSSTDPDVALSYS